MKELSIEEKAKRYDEALEMAKKLIENEETNVPVFYVNNIKDIFPELKESIDERIKKVIKQVLSESTTEKDECYLDNGVTQQEVFAWLDEQGEHANFRNKIQIGDKVTRNKDGVLVNLSQLNRVAKKDEKQGEQKSAWSEEDRRMLIGLIDELDAIMNKATSNEISVYSKYTNWLKSLRSQNTWKPSDKQMEALKEAGDEHWELDGLDPLYTLYQDLKNLKG